MEMIIKSKNKRYIVGENLETKEQSRDFYWEMQIRESVPLVPIKISLIKKCQADGKHFLD